MAPSSVNGAPGGDPAELTTDVTSNVTTDLTTDRSNTELLRQLGDDRRWLLQQLDSGQWPDLRLDLAALERELGQLLEQAGERLSP